MVVADALRGQAILWFVIGRTIQFRGGIKLQTELT